MEEAKQSTADTGIKAGARLHDVGQVPHTLRQEALARWGVNVEFNAARADGRYTGPVFASDEYLAQRVGEKSVVFHRKEQVDFATSENMQKRNDTNKLNETHLSIRYQGQQGKAYFHDPQRAAIEEIFSRIKKTAEERYGKTKKLETFAKQLDEIKDVMVDKYREARNRQFEQRTGQALRRPIEPKQHQAKPLER